MSVRPEDGTSATSHDIYACAWDAGRAARISAVASMRVEEVFMIKDCDGIQKLVIIICDDESNESLISTSIPKSSEGEAGYFYSSVPNGLKPGKG